MERQPLAANNQAGEQFYNDGTNAGNSSYQNSDSTQEGSKKEPWRNYLDNHYTFDSFIRGESNAVALSVHYLLPSIPHAVSSIQCFFSVLRAAENPLNQRHWLKNSKAIRKQEGAVCKCKGL